MIELVARRLSFFTAGILLAFSGAWFAMILLTWHPGSALLWFVNIEASKVFGEAFFVMQTVFGMTVVEVAVVFGILGTLAAVAGPRIRGARFLAAHLAAILVSLPLIKAAAASTDPSFELLLTAPAWSFDFISETDIVRLPLFLLGLTACVLTHVELFSRIHRDFAVRRRAHAMLTSA